MRTSPKDLNENQRGWLRHIKASRRSSQSISEYARDHDLEPQHLYTWATRFRRLGILDPKEQAEAPGPKMKAGRCRLSRPPKREEETVRFSPVELVSSPARPAGIRIRIRFRNGITLDSDGSMSPDKTLLAILASLP